VTHRGPCQPLPCWDSVILRREYSANHFQVTGRASKGLRQGQPHQRTPTALEGNSSSISRSEFPRVKHFEIGVKSECIRTTASPESAPPPCVVCQPGSEIRPTSCRWGNSKTMMVHPKKPCVPERARLRHGCPLPQQLRTAAPLFPPRRKPAGKGPRLPAPPWRPPRSGLTAFAASRSPTWAQPCRGSPPPLGPLQAGEPLALRPRSPQREL